MAQFVKRYDNINDLVDAPLATTVTQTNWSNLIMPPGNYQYNTPIYDMNAEGLYTIFNSGVDGGWRIIYNSDIYQLMSAFAWLAVYGRADESYNNAILATLAKTKKLSLRCGRTCEWAQSLLNSVGVQNRIVRLLTADTPNNFDDGHVAIEVKINGAWKLWDLANDRYFVDGSNNHLSLKDYFATPTKNSVIIADSGCDNEGYGSYQHHTAVYYDMRFRSEALTQSWIDRIYQIPGIDDGVLTYFYLPPGTESRQAYVLGLSPNFRVVSQSTWNSMFYP